MLEQLHKYFIETINNLDISYKRYFYNQINHNDKLVGIVGARGVGKTTYILQYLKQLDIPISKKLYISADNMLVSSSSLFNIAYEFTKIGGEVLAIDEIHKYKDFEKDLKQIYDMLNLKVIFSGSSAIRLEHSKADLSRRAVMYKVSGLSFREFLELKLNQTFKSYTLSDILSNHIDIVYDDFKDIKVFQYWSEYLEFGYYPFYFQNKNTYHTKLNETINAVIETDIPSIFKIKYENIINLKKLVSYICFSKPFKLNIKELSEKIGIDRDTLYLFMHYLDQANVLCVCRQNTKGDNIFSKPDKIYLHNTNINFSYCNNNEIGTLRESFFANQVRLNHDLSIPKNGDFLVDEKYIFEIGGAEKSFKQIKDIDNSFVVADNIEIGFGNKIPLYLFGFLY
jgi:predicted AAA+ superfamily ATPase